jgi:predicted DNA binding CopG/RHH family protein
MNRKTPEIPKFKSQSEEAGWWASRAGREYVKRKSSGFKAAGSGLVTKLNKKSTIQIAIRLPEADIAQARKLAESKGLGYQTLLKMLVHEGLEREARRR